MFARHADNFTKKGVEWLRRYSQSSNHNIVPSYSCKSFWSAPVSDFESTDVSPRTGPFPRA